MAYCVNTDDAKKPKVLDEECLKTEIDCCRRSDASLAHMRIVIGYLKVHNLVVKTRHYKCNVQKMHIPNLGALCEKSMPNR
jgi:hypothetical protein